MERELLVIARRQHGLFTTQQALGAGFFRAQIHHRTASDAWVTVARGLYRIPSTPYTWHTNVMAACLATGGAASHRTAAMLHGVLDARPGRPDVVVGRDRSVPPGIARVFRSTDLIPAHVTRLGGIPTTTPARLAMDLGAVVPYPTYEQAVDDLVARGLLTWDAMLDQLCRLSRRGRNGLGAARALLTERYGDTVPESVLERAFLALVRGAGLPEPEQQVTVTDADGFIARVDFAFAAQRVIVELDGRRYHLRAEAFEADRATRNRLLLAGWRVLVYTWEQVIRRGPAIRRELARALGI